MEEKIINALRTKYSNLGLSKEVLNGAAKTLAAFITSEDGIESAVNNSEVLLKAMQVDADRIRTEKTTFESKAKELETQLKKLTETQNQNNAPIQEQKPKTEQTPEWVSNLLDQFKTLSNEVQSLKAADVTAKRKKEFNEIISGLPQGFQKVYNRIDITNISDEDFNNLKSDVQLEVTELAKDVKAKGGVFNPPLAGGGKQQNQATPEEIKSVMENIKI